MADSLGIAYGSNLSGNADIATFYVADTAYAYRSGGDIYSSGSDCSVAPPNGWHMMYVIPVVTQGRNKSSNMEEYVLSIGTSKIFTPATVPTNESLISISITGIYLGSGGGTSSITIYFKEGKGRYALVSDGQGSSSYNYYDHVSNGKFYII